MKRYLIVIILILLVLECCSQIQVQESNIIKDSIPLLKYKGYWIHHSKSEFIMIDMNNLNQITFYYYTKIEIPSDEKHQKLKHDFFKSKGFIKGYHDNGFSVQTDKYRFDFISRNDTLFLWKEEGLDEAFIKLESSKE